MTVYSGSRYANTPVLTLPNDDGSYSPALFRGAAGLPPSFLHYVLHQGDRFDILADHFYGDSTLWWLIADANPEMFFPGGLLPIGQTIRIPLSN
jgi:nucleoid-associated protein YgaU